MTLVELMVSIALLASVVAIISGVFLSTGRFQAKTVDRADVQTSANQGLSLMTTELRHAGADPADIPIGLIGIVSADQNSIRIRADLNADGVIQTAEPSEDVTYTYDSMEQGVFRDTGSGPALVVSNVTTLDLTYFDASNTQLTTLPLSSTDAARVRSVGVSMTALNGQGEENVLTTRITRRNQ